MKKLMIGGLIFPAMDQLDFTGPFEVLARLPEAQFFTLWKDKTLVRDMVGLQILADTSLDEAPQLDLLLLPGGYGQEALMQDEVVLSFIRQQAKRAYVFCVCTGALLAGGAGLLEGKRATTHWSALEVLPLFGAIPSDQRVVIDGQLITAGGVTSGIDAALVAAALLCGETIAQELQLYMAYDPQPPFAAGSPASAPPAVFTTVRERAQAITAKRLATACQVSEVRKQSSEERSGGRAGARSKWRDK